MENPNESRYIKRTQKDYTMSFKLQIVQEKEPPIRLVISMEFKLVQQL